MVKNHPKDVLVSYADGTCSMINDCTTLQDVKRRIAEDENEEARSIVLMHEDDKSKILRVTDDAQVPDELHALINPSIEKWRDLVIVQANNSDPEALLDVVIAMTKSTNDDDDDVFRMAILVMSSYTDETVLDAVDHLLDHVHNPGEIVNIDDNKDGMCTPLVNCLIQGCSLLASKLIEARADVNARGPFQKTPLMFAAANNDVQVLKGLLAAKAITSLESLDGDTCLRMAVSRGFPDIVNELLNNEDNRVDVEELSQDITLFGAAIQTGKVEVVDALIKARADLNQFTKDGNLPLHVTLKRGDMKIANLLLQDRGPDVRVEVNLPTKDGETALSIATERGMGEAVDLILSSKADVNCEVTKMRGAGNLEKTTPLMIAIAGRNEGIAKRLIEEQANVNTSMSGRTALSTAVDSSNHAIVESLIASNADATARDDEGRTLLHRAARACVSHQSASGTCASYNSRDIPQCDLIVLLLSSSGAQVNVTSKEGDTCLQIAIEGGSEIMAQSLLTIEGIEVTDKQREEIKRMGEDTDANPETNVAWQAGIPLDAPEPDTRQTIVESNNEFDNEDEFSLYGSVSEISNPLPDEEYYSASAHVTPRSASASIAAELTPKVMKDQKSAQQAQGLLFGGFKSGHENDGGGAQKTTMEFGNEFEEKKGSKTPTNTGPMVFNDQNQPSAFKFDAATSSMFTPLNIDGPPSKSPQVLPSAPKIDAKKTTTTTTTTTATTTAWTTTTAAPTTSSSIFGNSSPTNVLWSSSSTTKEKTFPPPALKTGSINNIFGTAISTSAPSSMFGTSPSGSPHFASPQMTTSQKDASKQSNNEQQQPTNVSIFGSISSPPSRAQSSSARVPTGAGAGVDAPPPQSGLFPPPTRLPNNTTAAAATVAAAAAIGGNSSRMLQHFEQHEQDHQGIEELQYTSASSSYYTYTPLYPRARDQPLDLDEYDISMLQEYQDRTMQMLEEHQYDASLEPSRGLIQDLAWDEIVGSGYEEYLDERVYQALNHFEIVRRQQEMLEEERARHEARIEADNASLGEKIDQCLQELQILDARRRERGDPFDKLTQRLDDLFYQMGELEAYEKNRDSDIEHLRASNKLLHEKIPENEAFRTEFRTEQQEQSRALRDDLFEKMKSLPQGSLRVG